MRNNTCYWNNAWRQNNKPGLLLKIISMNFPMGFILDGALSKRHLKMVLKNKIVERCVEKLPQRKRNPSKCRSEQLSGIIYSFVHMPANLNEHIFVPRWILSLACWIDNFFFFLRCRTKASAMLAQSTSHARWEGHDGNKQVSSVEGWGGRGQTTTTKTKNSICSHL